MTGCLLSCQWHTIGKEGRALGSQKSKNTVKHFWIMVLDECSRCFYFILIGAMVTENGRQNRLTYLYNK